MDRVHKGRSHHRRPLEQFQVESSTPASMPPRHLTTGTKSQWLKPLRLRPLLPFQSFVAREAFEPSNVVGDRESIIGGHPNATAERLKPKSFHGERIQFGPQSHSGITSLGLGMDVVFQFGGSFSGTQNA